MNPNERNRQVLDECGFDWWPDFLPDGETRVFCIQLGDTWAKFTGANFNGELGAYLLAWKAATSAKHFLLYDGQSEDGRGTGKYIGRTLDPKLALEHQYKVKANPYSTGKVDVVTDNEIGTM